mmetsp:Transcript_3080/g.8935  ORF Transcript_3080/g.8935 Transcript_3080/m.8935 type:complete len:188 (+) Transcript_3080:193-756(+)
MVEPESGEQQRDNREAPTPSHRGETQPDHRQRLWASRVRREERPDERGDHNGSEHQYSCLEADEEMVVSLAHAIVHEGAVVVKPHDAMITIAAVRSARRSYDLTGLAPTISSAPKPIRDHAFSIHNRNTRGFKSFCAQQVMAQQSSQARSAAQFVNNMAPWKDARVATTGGKEESDSNREEDNRHER